MSNRVSEKLIQIKAINSLNYSHWWIRQGVARTITLGKNEDRTSLDFREHHNCLLSE